MADALWISDQIKGDENMGNTIATTDMTRELAARHRVLMLGGLAVIPHGQSRPIDAAEIWLDL